MFENKVLRKTFGLVREEVTVDSNELHNAELSEFYYEKR
jgi:hypothetical protein